MKSNAKKATVIGMFSAIAVVLSLVGKLVPSVAGFLDYDPKDIVVVICGFMLGPVSAFIVAVIASLIEFFSFSTSGVIGLIMNIISSVSFACIASLIYKKKRNFKSAIFGLALGVVSMTVLMMLWNYIITPFYMNVERDVVAGMLATVFMPFNLGKGTINAIFTVILYKPLVKALRRVHLVEERKTDKKYPHKQKLEDSIDECLNRGEINGEH